MRPGFALIVPVLIACGGCGGGAGAGARPAPAADGIPLGALPRQALAPGQCGLFLWKAAPNPRLVLMANSGPPPFARILIDGRVVDLARTGVPADFAASPSATYSDGRTTATLDLAIEQRRGLSDGAVVNAGSIRIDRAGGDGFVVPVTGLLACG